ncbi:TlpA family protein disulfide reductase [Sulfurovum sp. bin170]|uniref:TlpA family protein disulfide reductase n=1 Tax=Sulfurovum sp. bin170 TaxID=2695268 RepID=UPI0013DF35C9|nr:TlpA disulfide reductase family protein [Sulfurovum sp. bin170]NEW59897.1 TlpA family protein disulfide reductase [Sulfurovum sp. bin170]
MKKIILIILLALTVTLQAEFEKFTLTNTEGEKFNITESKDGLVFEEHKGKAIFLVLFGHNCPPCKEEIPELVELTEKYKDKLEIIAIEAQRYSVEQLKAFKKENGINYNLVTGKEHDDFVGYIANKAQWNGAIPFLIAIDKNGAVDSMEQGFIPKKTLEELIEKLTK